eukprot:IDg7989t1
MSRSLSARMLHRALTVRVSERHSPYSRHSNKRPLRPLPSPLRSHAFSGPQRPLASTSLRPNLAITMLRLHRRQRRAPDTDGHVFCACDAAIRLRACARVSTPARLILH